ncbi:MAG: WbqC family protein [Bacteroidia bacterium]
MKKVLISQSNYIPWKGYFDNINMVDEFVIYDEVQYTKRDWRSRNKIKTANGAHWLTVPVDVKGKYFQKIKEAQVLTTENWRDTHWKSIQMNYSKSPYFKTYKDVFEPIYKDTSEVLLSYINYRLIKAVNEVLGIKTPMRWSDEIPNHITGKNERLVEICKAVGATEYYSGPAAKGYMDETLFIESGINVHYFDYSNYPVYSQLYGEFMHEVSILDLIFNEGPDATHFMKSFAGR